METFFRVTGHLRGIHRSPVNSPHKCQGRGAFMFALICAWIKSWVNNGEAGDLSRHCAHYDVIVMTRENETCANSTVCASNGIHDTNVFSKSQQRYVIRLFGFSRGNKAFSQLPYYKHGMPVIRYIFTSIHAAKINDMKDVEMSLKLTCWYDNDGD